MTVHRVTANVIERVLEIESSVGSGTAFTIDYGGPQHLVTAKHLLPQGDPQPEVRVHNRHVDRTLCLDLLRAEPEAPDVAVAPLLDALTVDHALPPTLDGLAWSQPLFFLGFPYGLATETQRQVSSGRIAFIKGGILSAVIDEGCVQHVYIDAHNNPGFSGGPVVGYS